MSARGTEFLASFFRRSLYFWLDSPRRISAAQFGKVFSNWIFLFRGARARPRVFVFFLITFSAIE